MPKIIENLEGRLISEAKNQIEAFGYSNVTIRSVAKACGVGVGTVYNYFPSKEALIATHLLEDWMRSESAIKAVSTYSDSSRSVLLCIYDQLRSFSQRHEKIFRDETAIAGFAASSGYYHSLLRDQLAQPLRRFCDSDFAAQFIAESLLTWTIAGKSFDEIHGMVQKLF